MEPTLLIVLVIVAVIALGASTLYMVWPRPPEPDLDIHPLYPTVDTEVMVEALGRLTREIDAHGVRMQAALASLGAMLGRELRHWAPDATLAGSEREHPLAAALPEDREDFRYFSDATPVPDPIQAARDRILPYVDPTHVETAQRVMSEIITLNLSLYRVYEFARRSVPPRLWVRLLMLVREWENDRATPASGVTSRMAPSFPPDEVSFEQGGRPPGDGDTPA